MAKESSKKSFLDFFKVKDLDDDEFEDDLFDDDDEDDDDYVKPSKSKTKAAYTKPAAKQSSSYASRGSSYTSTNYNQTYKSPAQNYNSGYTSFSGAKAQQARPVSSNKLVDFNQGRQQRVENRSVSDVYVIKPHEMSESQTVVDFLNKGKTIVINMEGLELDLAQRIIDFIGGATYAIDGTLQAISGNIFIAAPGNIEVSGDVREEILNESTISPQLGRY